MRLVVRPLLWPFTVNVRLNQIGGDQKITIDANTLFLIIIIVIVNIATINIIITVKAIIINMLATCEVVIWASWPPHLLLCLCSQLPSHCTVWHSVQCNIVALCMKHSVQCDIVALCMWHYVQWEIVALQIHFMCIVTAQRSREQHFTKGGILWGKIWSFSVILRSWYCSCICIIIIIGMILWWMFILIMTIVYREL